MMAVEIDMEAPTVAPVVGGVYADRGGREHGPMRENGAGEYAFRFEGCTWTSSGKYFWDHAPHARDLIRVISEPGQTTPPADVTVVSWTSARIEAAETETMDAGTYSVGIDDDGDVFIRDLIEDRYWEMSTPAAVAMARAILRMTGEGE